MATDRPKKGGVGMLPAMTEKDWQKQVVDLAKILGWRVYHPFLSKWSEKGWPDLALVRERVVYAELKRENGKVSPSQVEWIYALTAAGQEVYVWRPSDFDEVARILQHRQTPEKEGER